MPRVTPQMVRYSYTRYALYFVGVALDLAVLALFLQSGTSARLRDSVERRIRRRTESLFDDGVVEEARALLARPLSPEARSVLGLSELDDLLAGRIGRGDAVDRIAQRTRQFAKRQMTFFRSFGDVRWLDVPEDEPAAQTARRVITAL